MMLRKRHKAKMKAGLRNERGEAAAASIIKPLLAVLLIAGLAFAAYKFGAPFFEKKKVVVDADLSAPVPVKAVQVKRMVLDRIDQLPGEIQAYQDVALFPKIPGFIDWIGIDRGSIVKKGDLLVKMYAPEYLAQRNEALAKVQAANAQLKEGESRLVAEKARLEEALAQQHADESTYARLKAASLTPGVVASNDVVLLAQRVSADRDRVSTRKHQVEAAEAEVAALAESLAAAKRSADNYQDFASYLNIVAPFDGYITLRNMHKGSFVGPLGNGAYPEIARIAQLQLLRIVVPVPERDCAGILPGAEVEFSVSTFPQRRFTGTVARIGNYLDKSTRTMPVELNYWNPKFEIFPGAFCKVYWPTRRPESSLFVPTSSVVTTLIDNHVCRIKDEQIEFVSVKKGQNMDGYVEVFSDDLKEADRIVLVASEELREGTSVSVSDASDKEEKQGAVNRPTYHTPSTN